MSTHAPQRALRPAFVVGSLVMACCARVARCPEPGESLQALDFIMEAGGKGFNVALALHRLGMQVDGLFALGDDPAGDFMRRAFLASGLDEGLIRTVDARSGAGVGLIEADGDNRIAVYPGANALLTADHVAAVADHVRGASIAFAQFEAPDAPIAAAFSLARAAGVPTMLNPSPYRPIPPEILGATDMLVVNEREAAALAAGRIGDGGDEGLAASLAEAGVGTLIVTRGSKGAAAWRGGVRVDEPGFAVEAVDSIGAGDAFAGAFAVAAAHGLGLAAALRWGCAAGAITVSRLGLVEAVPDKEELAALLGPEDGRSFG
ncbi:MAG: PfkB family carbohydrate kinase [Sphingobium sp.]